MTDAPIRSRSREIIESWKQPLYQKFIAPQASVRDGGEQIRAILLAIYSLVLTAVLVTAIILRPTSAGGILPLMALGAVSYGLSRSKYYNIGLIIFCSGLVVGTFALPVVSRDPNLIASTTALIAIVLIMAVTILTRKVFLAIGAEAFLLTFLTPIAAKIPFSEAHIRLSAMVFATAAILYGIDSYREKMEKDHLQEVQSVNRNLESAKNGFEARSNELALELGGRTDELTQRSLELTNLTHRMDRRKSQLAAVSEVSRSISTIHDLPNLLPGITSVVSRSFGFYHVGIFLLDDNREYALLSAANSEGGQRMLARSHRLQVGQEGIVGRVAATGRPRIALDVGTDAVFFNNPDLPETHSEIGLPLLKGDYVVGVLDVQSTEANAFSDEDIEMLGFLADQVSLAIENARLFGETERSLAEAETFSRQYLREAWGRLSSELQMVGYRYDKTGAAPLSKPVELAHEVEGNPAPSNSSQVGVPIQLRGEVIGDLIVQAPAGRKWTQDELDLIRAVAERVALSAENARLFEETNRRAERERMVSDITSKIRSSNDPNEMIRVAMQELKSALGVSRVEVIPQRVTNREA